MLSPESFVLYKCVSNKASSIVSSVVILCSIFLDKYSLFVACLFSYLCVLTEFRVSFWSLPSIEENYRLLIHVKKMLVTKNKFIDRVEMKTHFIWHKVLYWRRRKIRVQGTQQNSRITSLQRLEKQRLPECNILFNIFSLKQLHRILF